MHNFNPYETSLPAIQTQSNSPKNFKQKSVYFVYGGISLSSISTMATTSTSTTMDPPPPPPSSDAAIEATTSPPTSSSLAEIEEAPKDSSMAPPPNPKISVAELPPPSSSDGSEKKTPLESSSNSVKEKVPVSVPYSVPPWSEAPALPFFLEVLKDGAIIDHYDVTKKGAYMFGRIDLCDFILEHPTISRFHAVLQFRGDEAAYIYDLGSTHGTSVNKKTGMDLCLNKKQYVELRVGDVIRFGLSTRLYIFQGPEELMPLEADLSSIRYAKDREDSLRRAKENASHGDGILWGMREDAVEEAEDDGDEITWQTYKGELTEKQQKTREKVLKRMEKIAHMKKEMAAIRAKDISQGGLTQGQQTQIARNEQRISQILEELESLEETLNDSIRESMGARSGKSSRGKHKGFAEDEDELMSDDDEFYDRTKKKSANKSADAQSVETADSLLDKKEALLNEIDEKNKLLLEEKNKVLEPVVEQDTGDVLDAYMSGLSTQLVIDKTVQVEKDISSLQKELDRIVYLLKIADPTGETAKKRATAPKELKSKESASSSSAVKKPEKSKVGQSSVSQPEKPVSSSVDQVAPGVIKEVSEASYSKENVTDATENKPTTYKIVKPQWLGAVEARDSKESQLEKRSDTDDGDEGDETDGFIDYKERKKILETDSEPRKKPESDLESAAPGLILRNKKPAEVSEGPEGQMSNPSISEPTGTDMNVENAVALLLKHKRGIYTGEEEADLKSHGRKAQKKSGQDNKRAKRVLGPEKPAFLEKLPESDYDTWIPPEGQSGDGRTSLNDRLGY
ncbi:kanadaptin-like [Chenopodium quinoa]|uniref:kanadaptin-like n=1 Tax=Chenopodium quinoa TaxID=63459 RepID=UPI000B78FCCA|nr:kanadaptin-like [Chenopodium quinoa]